MHVLVGTVDDIDALRKRRTATNWVVPKSAIPGDPVLIFLRGEGLVASGRIESDPRPSSFGKRSVYRAALDDIDILERPVAEAVLHKKLPKWRWLSYPRSMTTPPPEVAERLGQLVDEARLRQRR